MGPFISETAGQFDINRASELWTNLNLEQTWRKLTPFTDASAVNEWALKFHSNLFLLWWSSSSSIASYPFWSHTCNWSPLSLLVIKPSDIERVIWFPWNTALSDVNVTGQKDSVLCMIWFRPHGLALDSLNTYYSHYWTWIAYETDRLPVSSKAFVCQVLLESQEKIAR